MHEYVTQLVLGLSCRAAHIHTEEFSLKHHSESIIYEQECAFLWLFDLYAHSFPTNTETKD